jgi:hypothetical protein
MQINMMRAKIHRATVTMADLHYEGSISIDADLLKASGILVNEKVDVLNINNDNITKDIQKKLTKMEKSVNTKSQYWNWLGNDQNAIFLAKSMENPEVARFSLITTSKRIMLNTNRVLNIL